MTNPDSAHLRAEQIVRDVSEQLQRSIDCEYVWVEAIATALREQNEKLTRFTDREQLARAVFAGVRCYRAHHPWSLVAKGLVNHENSSLAKRIVGELIALGQGRGFFTDRTPNSLRCTRCGHRAKRHRFLAKCAAPDCSCGQFTMPDAPADETESSAPGRIPPTP